MFDIFPARHRTRPLLVGAVALAVILFALLSAALRHVPLTPRSGRVITAVFNDADNITNRTVVRVGGVEVGSVQSVEPGPDPYKTSTVVMRITDPSVKLHSNASAAALWRTVFGGLMYIQLNPGSRSAPALQGPIPSNRTSHQVEIDQMLGIYAGQTAQQQRNLFSALRAALSNPAGIRQTIATLAPSMKTIGAGLQPLQGIDTGDLAGMVSATAATVHGLNDTSGLRTLVGSADRTLAVTSSQRGQLGQLLALSPPSLHSTFITMHALRTTLTHLDPTVNALQPGARELASAARTATPTMHELDAVLKIASPLLKQAGPTFASLRAASLSGVPLMNALNPTIQRTLSKLLPFLASRDSGTKLAVYEMIGPFWSDLASVAGSYDSVGYRIRLTVPPAPNSAVMDNPLAAQTQSACAGSALSARQCSRAHTIIGGWLSQLTGGRR
jgi:ABC-type transporter Mla subunit MlaD